jgi:uncharacterized protein YggE
MRLQVAGRCGVAGPLLAAAIGCDRIDERSDSIQVVGSAVIEKPAEVFRISGSIVERGEDRLTALSAASEKLDRIVGAIGGLDGLESYQVSSQNASINIARPRGCEFGERVYYGADAQRPEDCSPIEIGAVITIAVEGAPADRAGDIISFLSESDVEGASLLGYDVVDRVAAELEVKRAALSDAFTTAEALAAQAGVTIARPTIIRYGEESRFGSAPELRAYLARLPQFAPAPSRQFQPAVELSLSPTPVRFEADVAVTFAIENQTAEGD